MTPSTTRKTTNLTFVPSKAAARPDTSDAALIIWRAAALAAGEAA